MNETLAQAINELNLQPGQSRNVQVNGYYVEIRRPAEEPPDFSSMVMLQPWVDFPYGGETCKVPVRYAPHPLPDPPDIPPDKELGL